MSNVKQDNPGWNDPWLSISNVKKPFCQAWHLNQNSKITWDCAVLQTCGSFSYLWSHIRLFLIIFSALTKTKGVLQLLWCIKLSSHAQVVWFTHLSSISFQNTICLVALPFVFVFLRYNLYLEKILSKAVANWTTSKPQSCSNTLTLLRPHMVCQRNVSLYSLLWGSLGCLWFKECVRLGSG